MIKNIYKNKVNQYKNEKAITLIALVITIIVLIILAGISINLLLSDNGLLARAKSTKKMQDVARLQEALELEKGPVQVANDGNVDLESYLKQIQEGKKPFTLNSIEELDEFNAEVVVDDEYKFLVKDKQNGDVEIIYEGKVQSGSLTLSKYERNLYLSDRRNL